ncbi:maestro heat-like repeat-containing protein family member 7 [Fukomys damarensis]|uniref:maestro heat-like repeat-containing protein family member 7 n=1 Tax=Fukomys damarensis TaxID=885580 RepID=UPI00053F82EF|nr:maestro heat-like repeat-containing protein family member 7 [Fukomys damarensis]XP_033618040.1 maestro heat-like repeat-containing protein family member 7 [Fukomys damarensis]
MKPHPHRQKPDTVTFQLPTYHDFRNPNLRGLRQSEREAYQLIVEFIGQEQMSTVDKQNFLRAVEILSGAVRAEGNGNMNNYYPKAILAKKIETLILEESTEILDSSVRQQAMLCIVALSQVNPPFHLSEILDLVSVGVSSVFSLPLIMPSLDRKDSASLYLQVTQALDDMLQALVMDTMDPNMLILENFLEIILPWLTQSDKVHEQTRALGTISRLLRFVCNFPTLLHMESFSMSGKLIGILGLFCLNSSHEIRLGASEALHYLSKILVLQRSVRQKTVNILRNLQKHFRGEWFASMQNVTLFFRKYLTPVERADVIMVTMESMTSSSWDDIYAASSMLEIILKYSIPEIGKVSEIIQYIYIHMNNITEPTAQNTVKKVLYLLSQAYTDEVILTLFKIQDQTEKEVCKPWEILASFPKGCEVIMKHLLQRLVPQQAPQDREPSQRAEISPLIATRAIHELLLESSQQMEVQTFFSPLFIALLFQTSFLMVEGNAEMIQDQRHVAEWVDPVSSTVKALKTLLLSSGYGNFESEIEKLGGWELLVDPERHHDGVTVVARCLVTKHCWHNCPIFGLLMKMLQDPNCTNHFTALVFLMELLQCPDVTAIVDDFVIHILANWFNCKEPATVKLLLQMTEVFTKHKNLERRLHILKPQILNCCYSSDGDIVKETFLMLKHLVENLSWQYSSSFLIQLTFTLEPFFEEESEHLRLLAFQIYSSLLAKVKRKVLIFPLRHQILNVIVFLVLHLQDVNLDVAQACQVSLCSTAALLCWSKLREVFTKEDVFTIIGALLQQETNKALWFLKQCVASFKSTQVPIRQAAVWFAGQILQTLDLEEMNEMEEAYAALRHMRRDPDPMVSCLAMQTTHVLEAKEKLLLAKPPISCLCRRRPQRGHL